MKILEIILDNRLGGISKRALTVAEVMTKRGVTTHFLLPKEQGDVCEIAGSIGVVCHQILMPRPHPGKPLRCLLWALLIPVNVFQIRQIIAKHNIDAVHVNGLLNIPGFLAAKLSSVPILWHLAGTNVYPTWLVALVRPLLKRATVVICIAKAVRDYFLGQNRQKYNYRIIYEPFALSGDDDKKKSEGKSIRQELNLSEETFLVTSIGNVSPIKGYLYAIQGLSLLLKKQLNVHYLIVGELLGSQKKYYNKLQHEIALQKLDKIVTFAGKRTDIYDILAESDAFLLPSLSEGTPIAILEAMSMKVPVIASDVGGISEQIEDNISGLLVRPKSPRDIEMALNRYISNPDFAMAVAKVAHEKVFRKFSLDRFVGEYDKLLVDYVENKR